MSIRAVSWALGSKVDRSSTKFVLVALCNYANEFGECYPSAKQLSDDTAQDIKTVESNLKRLRDMGLLIDTGARRGSTKQIIVYRINPEGAPVSTAETPPKTDDLEDETPPKTDDLEDETPPKTDVLNTPVFPDNTPVFPDNTPVFPGKDPRFSRERPPKTGDGTVIEPSKEPSRNHKTKKQAAPFVLPDWIPDETWAAFLECRKKKKAANTDFALSLVLKTMLRIQAAGHDPIEALENSIKGGWSDVYEPKPRASQATGETAYQKSKRLQMERDFPNLCFTGEQHGTALALD